LKILGIEKVSFVDFEGKICATIFTGGCNLCCPFCHNAGIVNCSYQAYQENEILEYLKERKSLLDAVTISGGEPTLQPDLIEFIKKIKGLRYLVKLDTNGTNPEVLQKLIEENLLDYVAMDIKNNFEDYSEITGTKNFVADKIKRSLNILTNSGILYELRTTLVKGYHERQNIEKLAQDLKGQNLLYLQKFVDGDTCIKTGLQEVSKGLALEYKQILETTIDNVILRGY